MATGPAWDCENAERGNPHPPTLPRPANGASSAPSVATAASQERVLADMSHELGNLFHRLYYWAEYLRDDRSTTNGDGTATEMLERTIKHLEGFLQVALQYFAPMEVSPLRVKAGELLSSLISQLTTRMCDARVEVERSDVAVVSEVLVDPARMSQALEIAVRRVAHYVGEGSRLSAVIDCVTYGHRPSVELRIAITHPTEDSPFFRSAEAGLEWALMEKLMQLHGGGLQEHTAEGEECGFSLFIPTATEPAHNTGRAG